MYPFLLNQSACGGRYRQTTSAFSSWMLQGRIIMTSPTRSHTLLFILPGIRPMRVFPSSERTVIRLPPSIFSTVPKISFWCFLGSLTLLGCSSVSSTPHLIFDFHGLSSSQVGVGPYKLRVWLNPLMNISPGC